MVSLRREQGSDSLGPPIKRPRISNPSSEIGQLQATASPIAQNSGELDQTGIIQTATLKSSNHEPPATTNITSCNIPRYRLIRNLTTVHQVWQEYKYGINGNPSVESLLARYGKKCFEAKRLYYDRRPIYDFLICELENGKNEDESVNELETLRVKHKWPLSTLQFNIHSLTIDEESGQRKPATPVYQLLRNLTTVPEVWKEYKYGINGNPSVESLRKNMGAKWLKTLSQRQFFYARNRIYKFIINAIEDGIPEEETIKNLEQLRRDQEWTVVELQQNFDSLFLNKENGDLQLNTKPTAWSTPADDAVYKMLRNLTTVPELWQEYKYGINGHPSIERLVQEYGIARLKSLGDYQYYHARRKVYDYIINAINGKTPELEVINSLEKLRLDNNWSLNMLQLSILSLSEDNVSGQLLPSESAYKFARNLTTVNQVWEEYKHGIYGNPSIESATTEAVIKSLKGGVRQFYYKRKKIYDYIIDAVNHGQSEDEVVNELETLRRKQNWPLIELQTQISSLHRNNETGELIPTEPVYKLFRNLTTVHEVWQEYKYGTNGNPSVESIEKQFGTKWLNSSSELRFYYNRKLICDYINNSINNGMSESDAVKDLEDYRVSNNWSLYKLLTNFSQVRLRATQT